MDNVRTVLMQSSSIECALGAAFCLVLKLMPMRSVPRYRGFAARPNRRTASSVLSRAIIRPVQSWSAAFRDATPQEVAPVTPGREGADLHRKNQPRLRLNKSSLDSNELARNWFIASFAVERRHRLQTFGHSRQRRSLVQSGSKRLICRFSQSEQPRTNGQSDSESWPQAPTWTRRAPRPGSGLKPSFQIGRMGTSAKPTPKHHDVR